MELSEVIARIMEPDESITFTRRATSVRFVARKGNKEPVLVNEIAVDVDAELIKHAKIDLLAVNVRRAFEILR